MQGLMMERPLLISGLLEHAAAVHGDREIVSYAPEEPVHRGCYRTTAERVRQLAGALQTLGVGPGDRVATLACSTHRHLEVFYAVSGIGAVCHTVNPRLHPDQVAWILNHAADALMFVDLAFLPQAEAALRGSERLRHVVVMTDRAHMPGALPEPLSGALCYEELLARGNGQFDWPDFDENTAAALCYTSGTTGNPKGVLYSHRSQILHAFAVALPDVAGLSEADSVLPAAPMFHVNAWGIPYAAALTGARLVLPGPRLHGAALAELIEGRRRDDRARRADAVGRPDPLSPRQRPAAEHIEAGDRRRRGLPAHDDRGLPGRVRHRGPPRLGHDRDEPARHDRHPEGQAPHAPSPTSVRACRRSRGGRCSGSRSRSSMRMDGICRMTGAASARSRCAVPGSAAAITSQRTRARAMPRAGSPPAMSGASMRTDTCRSPTGRRT